MNNEELIRRIEALEKWKADREKQQITFPLDIESRRNLGKYFLSLTDSYQVGWAGSGQSGQYGVIEITQEDRTFAFRVQLIRYTANPADDTLTVFDKTPANKFQNGTEIVFYTNGTAPGGIVAGGGSQIYTVVNVSADGYTFEIEDNGGNPVDITDTGIGRQLILIVA